MEIRSHHKPKNSGKVERRHQLFVQFPASLSHPSWLSDACATRKDSELEWLAKDHLEANSIIIKPETLSHTAELFSWVLLPYCSLPRFPFPIKSLALSADVSSWTIHFRVLDKRPVSGPGRGLPSCNTFCLCGNSFLQSHRARALVTDRWSSV